MFKSLAWKSLAQYFQHNHRNIIMWRAALGKCHLAVEDEIGRFGCRPVLALCPYLLQLGSAELDSIRVAQFMKTIGREQNGVSGAELHDVPAVSSAREQPRR